MSILEMSVSGGAVILSTALLRLIAGERLPRRAYVALWLASMLRLLLPVKIASGISAFGLLPESGAQRGSAAAPAAVSGGGFPVMTAIWLAGAAAMGLAVMISYLRCVRAFRTSVPVRDERVSGWLSAHPLRRRVEVRELPGLKTPLTYGVLRPRILLPQNVEGWDREKLDMVLCHEHTHIRRFDGALKLLAALTLCVHWWNPAVWLMFALLDRDMELACDGAVVERFGPECRARYARLLIDLKAPKGAAALVTGFGRNVTEKRVRGVMGHRRATGWAVALAAVLAVAILAVFATTARPDTPEAAPQPPETGTDAPSEGPNPGETGPETVVIEPEENSGPADLPQIDTGDSPEPVHTIVIYTERDADALSLTADDGSPLVVEYHAVKDELGKVQNEVDELKQKIDDAEKP